MLSKSRLGNNYSFYKELHLLQHRVKKKVAYRSDTCYGISLREEEINMQEDSLNREDMTRKNDYWVELDRKYRAQVRKTRSIVLEKGKGVEVWDVEGKKYLVMSGVRFFSWAWK